MKSLLIALLLCTVSAAAASASPRKTDTFDAKCNYRCCDENRNCAVHYFYMGGKTSGWTTCDWVNVCSKQGTPGWSYGGTPSEKNSTVTRESGCWERWEDWSKPKPAVSIKACAAPAAHAKPAAHGAPAANAMPKARGTGGTNAADPAAATR